MKHSKFVTGPTLSILTLTATLHGAPEQAAAGNAPFIGDIVAVGETYCPSGWVSAEGQLLPIASYTPLFALVGTTYGGDGQSTFGIPDLRGRAAMGQGSAPPLTAHAQGAKFGAESQVLTASQLPSHSHTVYANNLDGDKPGPGGKLLAAAPTGGTGNETIYSDQPATVQMSTQMIAEAGQNLPFDVQDPFLVMRYCIATQGDFPPRP